MFRTMTLLVLLTVSVSSLLISKTGYDTPKAPTFQEALAAGSIEGLLLKYALKELDVDPSAQLNEDTIGKLIDVVQDSRLDQHLAEIKDADVDRKDLNEAKEKLLETLRDFKQKAPGIIARAERDAPNILRKLGDKWESIVRYVKSKIEDL